MRRRVVILFLVTTVACSPGGDQASPPHAPYAKPSAAPNTSTSPDLLKGTIDPSPQSPMRVGNGVTAPVVTKRVEPDYEACKGERVWGFPILEAVIDEHGRPTNVRVLKPVHPCLERVIVAALEQWEFKPGTYQGKPVPVVFNLTVNIHWR